MLKKLFALTLLAATLSACSEDKPQTQQPELACNSPAVNQAIRSNIQEIIKQEARAFARNDSRQFVDADKLIAAGSQLEISLDNAQTEQDGNRSYCSAGLKVSIPEDILAVAQTNSPLIYGDVSVEQLLEQKLMGSNTGYAGGVFTTKLSYTPNGDGVTFEDNTLTNTAQNISAALLPYGVKSILIIDGKAVKREDALRLNLSQAYEEPPQADPEDLLDNNAASQAEGVPQAEDNSNAEILTPAVPENDSSVAMSDLEAAREQNQVADNEINRLWNSMDKTVQKEILADQRSWIQNKNYHCMQAAAQADNPAQAEYLKLQCDTRMTRERVQYLKGYTIN